MSNAISCGIDFGTSNSSLAYSVDGKKPVLSLQEDGKPIIPSIVFFPEKGGETLFGQRALSTYVAGEHGRFMRSLKRVLGTSLMQTGTVLNGRRRRFDDIISLFIARMKENAESECGRNIDSVIMGRPVHFRDNDSEGDRRAQAELETIAKSVGFKHVAFQYEPIAAAFAHEAELPDETLAVVVDIGGGTSDFSVIRIGGVHARKPDRKQDILANMGVRIGGNDFDKDLSLEAFMPHLGYGSLFGEQNLTVPMIYFHELSEWSMVNLAYNPKNIQSFRQITGESQSPEKMERFLYLLEHEMGHRLLMDVEEAKIFLTEKEKTVMQFDYIPGMPYFSISRAAFEACIKEDCRKAVQSMQDCIHMAGVQLSDINLVILTGGSTEIPLVRQAFTDCFPNAKLSQGNKLSSVGIGLAYDAIRRF